MTHGLGGRVLLCQRWLLTVPTLMCNDMPPGHFVSLSFSEAPGKLCSAEVTTPLADLEWCEENWGSCYWKKISQIWWFHFIHAKGCCFLWHWATEWINEVLRHLISNSADFFFQGLISILQKYLKTHKANTNISLFSRKYIPCITLRTTICGVWCAEGARLWAQPHQWLARWALVSYVLVL